MNTNTSKEFFKKSACKHLGKTVKINGGDATYLWTVRSSPPHRSALQCSLTGNR